MRFHALFLLLGMTLPSSVALFAQNFPIHIQIAVLPPYSPRLSDYFTYENQIVMTLTADPSLPPNTRVKFACALSSDNGIHIATRPDFQPPSPLTLNPGETRLFNGVQLQPYFDVNQVQFSGITRAKIEQNGALPEGFYTLCVTALDFFNNQALSEPEPGGCSGGFFIQHVEPPELLAPECGAQVSCGQPQNVFFSWSYPVGVTAPVRYLLKIVEVIPPNRELNEAMNVSAAPPFFERIVDGQSYVYGIADPPLQPGRTYAVQITALDPTNTLAFHNEGRSEVCGFTTAGGPEQQPCLSNPTITPDPNQPDAYRLGGIFSCSDACGTSALTPGVLEGTAITWAISSGQDVAVIEGDAHGASVKINRLKPGSYALSVQTRTECLCMNCEGHTTITTDSLPTQDCKCVIDHLVVGGTAIKVTQPLTVHNHLEEDQGRTLGFSALATDQDMIIQKCKLVLVYEKLIEKVGDPVVYAWSLEGAPPSWSLLDADASSVMLVLPPYLKNGEKEEGLLKLTVSSANDETIEGSAKITLIGRDTCERDSAVVEITPLKEKEDKIPTITQAGKCVPQAEKWDKKAAITLAVTGAGKYVQAGQATFFKAAGKDVDELTLFCKSDDCGNPQKTLTLEEPLVYTWQDGGKGGRFVPAGGSGVFYIAPENAGKVKITCKAADAGNHRAASGETAEATAEIQVVDALAELNISQAGGLQTFFTAGGEPTLKSVWSETPPIQTLVSRWCLDLGSASGRVETLLEKAAGLSNAEASLAFSNSAAKDAGRVISWEQHHHIHGKYRLSHGIAFRFKGEKIVFTDEKWAKSNFLEGAALDEYKLFFNKKNTGAARRDDGKWRDDKTQDDDLFGKPLALNGSNPPEWIVHWAENTYKPCDLPADFKVDLARTDPTFVYGDAQGEAHAEYKWLGGENTVIIDDKSAETATLSGFKAKTTFISSDWKWIRNKEISLPGYKLEGLECFTKVVSHELAHWQAIHKNWGGGGDWQTAYGEHRLSRPWAQVATVEAVDLKKMTYDNPVMAITYGKPGDITMSSAVVTNDAEDAAAKYSFNLSVSVADPTSGGANVLTVAVSRGWFVDGDMKKNGKGFESGRVIFYTEHNGVTTCTYNGIAHTSQNGIVVYVENSTIRIFERHNDLDGDFVPNLVEDELGLDWRRSVSHNNTGYHGKPNDQEFWAEWATKDLIDAATKRLKKGICDPEKDWANPGLQTKK